MSLTSLSKSFLSFNLVFNVYVEMFLIFYVRSVSINFACLLESTFFDIKMFACFNDIRIFLHLFCGHLVVSWIMFQTFQQTRFYSRLYTPVSRLPVTVAVEL